MSRFETDWEIYRRKVLPSDATPAQITEAQLAYYSYRLAIFSLEAPDEDAHEALRQELLAFAERKGGEFAARSREVLFDSRL